MSELDFDKSFGKGLDRERFFEPTEAGWEKVSAGYAAKVAKKRRRRTAGGWVLPFVAAVSLVFMGIALNRAVQKAAEMESEIAALKSYLSPGPVFSRTDTAVQVVTTVRYDTVFKTLVVRRRVFEGPDGHRGQLLDLNITRASLCTLYGDPAILNFD